MTNTSHQVSAVEARGLHKRYGELVALRQVDLTVHQGDVYGYLGPNGAGKTTSLRIALGLIRPSGGTVRLFGHSPADDPILARQGVAGFVEDPTFYPYLSGRHNLEQLAALDDGAAADEISTALETVGLAGRAHDKVRGYSHGMRQRLGIAAALIRRPRLLILDEPTTGLDPAGMRDMRALVRDLAASGMTVLLSSHLMDEVEQLCNRVAIIQRGEIRYEGDIGDLLARAAHRYRLESPDPTAAFTFMSGSSGVSDLTRTGAAVGFAAEPAAVAALTIALGRAGIGIHALVPETQSLEALFFDLTETRGAA